ncbi:MAG: hypothetical protein B6245_09660 [Desulfobacteraceae bacterium 4572_88]|nr:MAG: hypothetical protein B6245_09660 [Desulfobacteraceae bacterium 4572_88]
MPQITLEIPEIYNYRLEQTAKTQEKTLQEIVVDAIRKFIDAEEKNTDTDSPDALDVLDRLTGTVEAPENWAILHDHYLYGTPRHDGKV